MGTTDLTMFEPVPVQGSNYIMSANGTSEQSLQFSPCSLDEMNKKMAQLSQHRQGCFTDRRREEYRR